MNEVPECGVGTDSGGLMVSGEIQEQRRAKRNRDEQKPMKLINDEKTFRQNHLMMETVKMWVTFKFKRKERSTSR